MDKPVETAAANYRVADYTATIMHELKTPLSAIIVSAELLGEELGSDEQSDTGRLVCSIIRNAHRLKERLGDLSKVTQWLVADFRLVPEAIDLGQLISNVTTRIYAIFQGRGQQLVLDIPPSLPPVRADRQCLEQIVENLLSNASNFTPEGGRITVASRRDDDALVTRVSDTGVGIPKREWGNIFKPYYRLGRGSGKLAGSGLGLTITRTCVEKLGGRVWLESEEQKGSSFFFSLPLDRNLQVEGSGI
ncbi:MAG: sensor histidine kinase [Dehalococcoidia bacterium]|nr:MAG: sensor histidine kinase [Dehalococcoidia bacterium]